MTFLKMRKSFRRGWSWTTGRGAVVQYIALVLDVSWNLNFNESHLNNFDAK